MIAHALSRRAAFTMIELVAVLLIIVTLVSLLLPAVQSSRESVRRSSCVNNLTQIGVAVQAYHLAFDQLPIQLSGTDGSTVAGQDNDRRLSFLVGLLPFVGEGNKWDSIQSSLDRKITDEYELMMAYDAELMYGDDPDVSEDEVANRPPWVAGGPEPFDARYPPWAAEVPVYRCPSDPGYGGRGSITMARVNYACCLGDGVVGAATGPMKEVNGRFVFDASLNAQVDASMRGVFVPRVVIRLSDVTDGLSHTLMLAEINTDLGDQHVTTRAAAGPGDPLRDDPDWARKADLFDPDRPVFWLPSSSKLSSTPEWGRGLRWADGMPLYTGFNTILPPNAELVMRQDTDDCWGILPPSSRHVAGVNACFADGAVRFISDSIDAGRSDSATVYLGGPTPPGSESPFGLWGALGTRASGELRWLGE